MADNFGLKIGIEGEKEFKKALSEINQSFKVLGSEMKLVDSQFDKNDRSIQALSARNTVLNKEIDAQKQKIETLRSALHNASESFGENDKRTQNWQIQLNNAQAALNSMEKTVASNTKAIDSMNDEIGDTSDEDNFKKSLADIENQFKVLGSEMKLVDSQFDKHDKSVESLSARNTVLNKEIDTQKDKIETLRSALAHSAETYGETDQRTRDWQIQLNNAEAALNSMEREVANNTKAIDSMSDEIGDTKDEDSFKKSLADIESQFKVLGSEMKLVDSQFDKNDKSVESLSARNAVLNKEIDTQKDKVETLRSALAHSAETYGENDERTRDWQVQLNNAEAALNSMEKEVSKNEDAIDEMGKETDDTADSLDDLEDGLEDAGDTAEKSGGKFEKLGSILQGIGTAIAAAVTAVGAAVGAIAGTINDCVDVYASFEDSMLQVAATMGITSDEIANGSEAYEMLTSAAKEAGATTRYSASEAGDALNYLALAGYDAEKAVETLPKVLDLAAAGGMDLATTSDLVTDAMSALGLETSELDTFVDQLAKTSQKSNTNVQALGEGLLVCAGTASSTGQELAITNTALGILADNGIKSAEGGTHLRNILLALSTASGDTKEELNKLVGSVYDVDGNMRQLDDIMTDMNASLSEMSQESRTNIINKIFNKTDIGAVNALLKATNSSFFTISDTLETTSIDWEKYQDSAWYSANGVKDVSDDIIHSLNGLKMSTDELQEHLQLEYGLDAEDALAAIESVSESLKATVGDVDKVSEAVRASSVDWEKYADCAWYANGNIEGLTDRVLFCTTKLGESAEEIQDYLQNEYDLDADDALAVIESVNASLEENGNRWQELSGLIEESTGAAAEMAGTMEAGLAGTTRSFNSAVEGMQVEIGGIFAGFKQDLMTDSIDVIRAFTLNLQEAGGDWEKIGVAIGQALGDIINLISEYLPKFVDMGVQILETLGSALMDNLDVLIETTASIVETLLGTVIGGLPALIEAMTAILMALLDTVISMLPSLVGAAAEIVASLAKGIGEALPTLIPTIVQAMVSIVQTLIDNLPLIRDAALQLTTGLADGLLAAIPVLIEALPPLIESIVDFIMGAIPQNIEAGIQLFTALVGALPEIIAAIVEAIPKIIDGILTGLADGLPQIIEAGVQLLTSLISALPDIIAVIVSALPQIIDGILASLLSALPQLIEAGVQLLTSLISALPEIIAVIVSALPQIIDGILAGLLSALPQLIAAGVQLFTALVGALPEIISAIVGVIPQVITGLIEALTACTPQIINTGIQLFTSLVDDSSVFIDNILQVIPEIISGLVTSFVAFVPQITETGVQLITSLVNDLPNIITTILGAIPKIIQQIIEALVKSIPQIVTAGVELLSAIAKNIPAVTKNIIKEVPQIITGIVNTLREGQSKLVEIGGNLVKGLWDGIQQLKDWLWNKVSGWISSIWDGICDFFGIHSPSRQMAWVGEMLVKGLSGSIDENGDEAVSAAEEMAEGVLGAFNDISDDISDAFSGSFDLSVDTSSATAATEKMAKDINDVMDSLAADMTSVLPDNFNIDADVSGALAANTQTVMITSPLFTVQQMIVRSDDDIRRVSQDLYNMIQTGSRAQGLFTLA